jgi:glycosyltransferase involved in cell wall biosynthesis
MKYLKIRGKKLILLLLSPNFKQTVIKPKMPVAIVSVTNDLTTDQRVNRTCLALVKSGYQVLLVGRRLRNSVTLTPRPYQMHRMRLLFEKGPLFYAEYNISLFFFLLLHKYDLVVSNDLDTLPANFLANRIKFKWFAFQNKKEKGKSSASVVRHLHDCHEYFRGMPELTGRKKVLKVWKWIEDRIFPKLTHVVAVNQSVADLYTKEYGNIIVVIRNMPFRKPLTGGHHREQLHIAGDQRIILYQGAVNVDRGLEEAVLAMRYMKTQAVLIIAGIGDIYKELKKLALKNNLEQKVIFLGQVPFQELHAYTRMADMGISIEKDVSINYHYCLPNKFLDYIQAGVPVLVSAFPEMKAIVDHYHIGEYLDSHDPMIIADQFDSMLNDEKKMAMYKSNLIKAAEELCWETEEAALSEMLSGKLPGK